MDGMLPLLLFYSDLYMGPGCRVQAIDVDKMRILTLVLIPFILSSCRTGMGVRKSKVSYFDSSFSATVSNHSFDVKGQQWGDNSLLQLFEIGIVNTDSVSMRFNDSNALVLSYKVHGQKFENVFNGKFADKGYYEIYFRNESKEIPPGFHIIYSKHNINRLRIALTKEGDLLVDNMWDESGNIFIITAGGSGRRLSYFEINP